jgi:hypothetical protein
VLPVLSGAIFVCVTPQNFYPGSTAVTIGESACTNVVHSPGLGFQTVTCWAPSGPGIGDVFLWVTVGTRAASIPFLYDPPSVSSVGVVAVAADANVMITVLGSNLGLKNSASSPDPVVYIGGKACFQPVLLPSLAVQCTALASPVGAYPVIGALCVAVVRAYAAAPPL